MSLVLHVDGERWRTHLREVAGNRPGLVPVIKGNGYGFGLGRLARKSAWLGVDTIAVGTPAEVAEVASRFDGDIVVLTPWRSFDAGHLDDAPAHRLIHTLGRLEDLAELPSGSRVLLELLTSMKRHGFTPRELRTAVSNAQEAGLVVEGCSIHLPLGSGDSNRREASELLTDVVAAGLSTVWVSHLAAAEVAALAAANPDLTFRQRVGTDLWLGARDALQVTAHVLDSHPLDRGEVVGYRGRSLPRSGTVVVVSGGTAHGIGLEAPTGEASVRARVGSVARGGLDALGLVKSPFTVSGKVRYFVEPPHMQASMLFLPSGAVVPEIGESVPVRIRFTATTVDAVVIS